MTGVVLAHELLDAVPCVIAQCRSDGAPAVVLVEPATGRETLGGPLDEADATWLADWWPMAEPGRRAEIGRQRDTAWAGLVGAAATGLVLAVDYDHSREQRALLRHGTLAAYREGRSVPPVPDGTCDLTAHVAFDACAAVTPRGGWTGLVRQAEALSSLGVTSALPTPLQANTDPQAYAAALAQAAESRLLLDPDGAGGFGWLLHGRGVPEPDWEMMRP